MNNTIFKQNPKNETTKIIDHWDARKINIPYHHKENKQHVWYEYQDPGGHQECKINLKFENL